MKLFCNYRTPPDAPNCTSGVTHGQSNKPGEVMKQIDNTGSDIGYQHWGFGVVLPRAAQ